MQTAADTLRMCLAAVEPETDAQHLLLQHRHFVYDGGGNGWRSYAGHFFEIKTNPEPGVDIYTTGLQHDGSKFAARWVSNVRLTSSLLRNLERLDRTLWELQDLMQDNHLTQAEALHRAKKRLSVLGVPDIDIVLDVNDKPTFAIEIRRK